MNNLQLTDADAVTIAGLLKGDTKTKRVFVGRNNFGNAGASAIAAAVGASSTIEELWMTFCKFDDAAADDLAAALSGSSSLKELWVRGNKFTAAGTGKLTAAGKFVDHELLDVKLPEVAAEEVEEDAGDEDLVW